jgi:hypothetical protein
MFSLVVGELLCFTGVHARKFNPSAPKRMGTVSHGGAKHPGV